jgi:hypothetical protein
LRKCSATLFLEKVEVNSKIPIVSKIEKKIQIQMNSTSKVKKPKFQMGSIGWGLQAQPKIIKKTIEARNQPIETKKNSKKYV